MLNARRVTLGLLGLGATVAMAAPTTAVGAVQIGETVTPNVTCNAGLTWLQSSSPGSSYAAPSAGVLTSWSFQAADDVSPMKLKVASSVDGANFRVEAESELETPAPSTLNTFPTRLPIATGNVIGYYLESVAPCARRPATADHVTHFFEGDVPPDQTQAFTTIAEPAQFDLSAQLEPDADADGFGDETQDGCPGNPLRQDDCSPDGDTDTDPPETEITKGAPNKLDKSKVKFKFTSDEPGSTFECKIDKKPFKPCTSPRKVKRLDDGKHKFKVIATDEAGNSDPSAAKDKFKVVD